MWTELVNFYWWMIASPQHAVAAPLMLYCGYGVITQTFVYRFFEGRDKVSGAIWVVLFAALILGVLVPSANNASGLGGIMVSLGTALFVGTLALSAIAPLAAKR